jgi:hypothetical protein
VVIAASFALWLGSPGYPAAGGLRADARRRLRRVRRASPVRRRRAVRRGRARRSARRALHLRGVRVRARPPGGRAAHRRTGGYLAAIAAALAVAFLAVLVVSRVRPPAPA